MIFHQRYGTLALQATTWIFQTYGTLGAPVGVKNVAKHRIYIEKAYSGVLVSQNAVLNLMSLMDAIKKTFICDNQTFQKNNIYDCKLRGSLDHCTPKVSKTCFPIHFHRR